MIREMTEHDIQQVAMLDKVLDVPWTEQMLLDTLHQSNTHMFVLLSDEQDSVVTQVGQLASGGKIIGYSGFEQVLDEGNIYNIVVDSSYFRRGYGSQLLQSILDKAKCLGLACLFLEVNVNNAAAIALYHKYGFKVISTRFKYYNLTDGYVMKKIL